MKLKIREKLFQRISVCYRLNRGKLASPNVSSQLAPLVAFVTPHSTNTAIPPTNAIPLSLSSSSTSSGLFVEAYYIEYLWQWLPSGAPLCYLKEWIQCLKIFPPNEMLCEDSLFNRSHIWSLPAVSWLPELRIFSSLLILHFSLNSNLIVKCWWKSWVGGVSFQNKQQEKNKVKLKMYFHFLEF